MFLRLFFIVPSLLVLQPSISLASPPLSGTSQKSRTTQSLIKAIMDERPLSEISVILNNFPDLINETDSNLDTPLHLATKTGNVFLTEILLKAGANPNAENAVGTVPLYFPCRNGYLEVAKLLLQFRANPNTKDRNEWTLLHCAERNNHLEIMTALIERGADVNAEGDNQRTPLHNAVVDGHLAQVKILLNAGANPNTPDRLRNTPLILAADNGNIEIIQELLNYKADVNLKDKNSSAPLHFAASYGHCDALTALLDKGAPIDEEDKDGSRALHFAVENGHLDVVKLLLDRPSPANIDLTDRFKLSPLHLAAQYGQTEILTFLIERGAKIEEPGDEGWSPLLAALYKDPDTIYNDTIRAGRIQCAMKLIEQGANFLKEYRGPERVIITPLSLIDSPRYRETELPAFIDSILNKPIPNQEGTWLERIITQCSFNTVMARVYALTESNQKLDFDRLQAISKNRPESEERTKIINFLNKYSEIIAYLTEPVSIQDLNMLDDTFSTCGITCCAMALPIYFLKNPEGDKTDLENRDYYDFSNLIGWFVQSRNLTIPALRREFTWDELHFDHVEYQKVMNAVSNKKRKAEEDSPDLPIAKKPRSNSSDETGEL